MKRTQPGAARRRGGTTLLGVSVLGVVAMMLALAGIPAWADEPLGTPAGAVILTIDGKITNTNTDGTAVFDMDMLKRLENHTIKTRTPWTDGVQTFEGPLLRDLMALVDAQGSTIRAVAINDYFVEIPMSDLIDYAVILAVSLNGQPMRIREKGPLWVMYPWDDVPDLNNEKYFSRSIWQTKSLTVK